MNYFDNINFEKGVITVLGVAADSPFVTALSEHLNKNGTVMVTDKRETKARADYIIIAPDTPNKNQYIFHSEEDMKFYSSKGLVIGYLSVNLIEKEIKSVVVGAEDFCSYSNLYTDELMFPRALARAISEREKYDLIYIDDVCGEGKRYFARDINRYITYGAGVRMINTDSCFVEELQKAQKSGVI